MTAIPRNWFDRQPGCGPSCRPVYGHDPASHEMFGRVAERREKEQQSTGVVRTGPLIVDFGARRATVGGQEIVLSPTETRVLLLLAARIGETVAYRDLAERIWGPSQTDCHILYVNVTRLRARLGPAAGLLTTRIYHGYQLEAVPPEGGEGEP